MKWKTKDLIYSYMLLAGASAIVASGVFCLTVYWDDRWVSGFMF